ncbi:unnamed protein product [Amoebophrya sp. A25]|nr:unnamed protein product [Amoebophrya sp. A25]|eukprot:GSA25T00021573001.1
MDDDMNGDVRAFDVGRNLNRRAAFFLGLLSSALFMLLTLLLYAMHHMMAVGFLVYPAPKSCSCAKPAAEWLFAGGVLSVIFANLGAAAAPIARMLLFLDVLCDAMFTNVDAGADLQDNARADLQDNAVADLQHLRGEFGRFRRLARAEEQRRVMRGPRKTVEQMEEETGCIVCRKWLRKGYCLEGCKCENWHPEEKDFYPMMLPLPVDPTRAPQVPLRFR